MRISVCKFSGNKRIPTLLDNNGCPYFLPLLYTITRLRGKAFNTKKRALQSIKIFYSYCFDDKKIQLENEIISGNYKIFSNQLIDELIIKHALFAKPHLIEPLQSFISWFSNRYYKNTDTEFSIQQQIKLHVSKNTFSLRANYRSLTTEQIASIRDIIKVNGYQNPFRVQLQFRNWLIFELFLQSGIRCGELLKLKVDDFIRVEERFYIRIQNHTNDPEETRLLQPSTKNTKSYRIISLSLPLHNAIHEYILNYRKPIRNGKRQSVASSYLFISERGSLLSMAAVQAIFREIRKKNINIYPSDSDFLLSAHVLRHTFADNFLAFLLDEMGMEMERAKDELRTICGWAISSPMPVRYANRYINNQANSHNINRINRYGIF